MRSRRLHRPQGGRRAAPQSPSRSQQCGRSSVAQRASPGGPPLPRQRPHIPGRGCGQRSALGDGLAVAAPPELAARSRAARQHARDHVSASRGRQHPQAAASRRGSTSAAAGAAS
eukprot:TRINITY_DN33534_c0_g1_i1.p2 TRINITY_DN33534_c0_g1~~TRINITY_DN33534_c0_g1_i1.p2  ORF type:complete len:115 (+),score=3.03 TRINITY_DN33534_c0_g1_i1:259-603(+)